MKTSQQLKHTECTERRGQPQPIYPDTLINETVL